MKRFHIPILLFLYSCSGQEFKPNPILEISIEPIEIAIDDSVQYEHVFIQLVDSCTVVGLDLNYQRLDFFDICDKKFLKTISFDTEGPHAINAVTSYYYHNEDSIFLYSLQTNQFYLTNSKAKKLNSWLLGDQEFPDTINVTNGTGLFWPMSTAVPFFIEAPFYFSAKDHSLFIQILAGSNQMGLAKLETVYTSPLVAKYSLDSHTFVSYYGAWPYSYQEAEELPNNPINSFVYQEESAELVSSVYNSNSVYSNQDKTWHVIKSNYESGEFTRFSRYKLEAYSTEDEVEAFNLDEGYTGFFYNKYDKRYYRIFKQKQSDSGVRGEKPNKMEAKWSIVVADSALKPIGEIIMEKSTYNFFHIVPTPQGLLVSKENPWSETNREDTYAFDMIKIQL